MAILDARISCALPSHPKTKKLIRRLGAQGAWSLVCLFLWTAANRRDGDLSGMTGEDIEMCANWPGDDGALVAALVDVRFLDGDQGAYRVHDWQEHNPWAAGSADRSLSSKWAALVKRYGRAGAAERMPDYATRMRLAHEAHATRTETACDPDAEGVRQVCGADAPLPLPLPRAKEKQDQERAAPLAAVAVKEPDPIFGVGLEWIVSKGTGQPIARSMLGKLRQAAHGAAGGDKDAGDLILIECIAEAMAQDVINPFPWLRQAVLARGKPAPAEHDELAWMDRKVLQ